MNQNILKYILKMDQQDYIDLQKGEKEVVSLADAAFAYTIVENLEYKTPIDFYIGSAALNLLNTYVKQDDSLIGYSFKKNTAKIVDALAKADLPELTIDLQMESGMRLLMISICGEVQFSFHQPTVSDKQFEAFQKKKGKHLVWDGVRKQQCAVSVFHHALITYPMGCSLDIKSEAFRKAYATMEKSIKKGEKLED